MKILSTVFILGLVLSVNTLAAEISDGTKAPQVEMPQKTKVEGRAAQGGGDVGGGTDKPKPKTSK